jgi:N-methylhydantoinase A
MVRAIVPIHPGQFSAFGFTATDARVDRQRTVQMTSHNFDYERASRVFHELEADCRAQLQAQGSGSEVVVTRWIEMRYHGQNYELSLPFTSASFTTDTARALWAAFDRAHEDRFGFAIPGEFVELVNFSVTGVQELMKPGLPELQVAQDEPVPVSIRSVMYDQGRHDTPVYRREMFNAHQIVRGPAVIEEAVSAVVLRPDQTLSVDGVGNMLIERNGGQRK